MKLSIASFGLIAALAFGGWQTIQLSGARAANSILTAQLSDAQANVKLCNASVTAAKQLADEKQRHADDLRAAALKDVTVHVTNAGDILKLPTPAPDQECAATLQLLKDRQ